MKSPRISLLADLPPNQDELSYDSLNFPLFLHEDVVESVPDHIAFRRRLALVLQHLAAHGRTGVVKSCSDATNRGWRRTPLGGTGGMQYYLWWAPAGSQQVPSTFNSVTGQTRSIWVRAVRHHDDMTPLRVGDAEDDYFELHQRDIDGSDKTFVDSPWTDQQLEFVNSTDPVRIVYGYPGSGKTTALWRAVETRNSERVLYTSWSRELVDFAGQHLVSFAPSGAEVIRHDFLTLLGAICRYDIPRRTQEQCLVTLEDAIRMARIGRPILGPWADQIDALYAEIRAVLLGMAVDDAVSATTSEGLRRLTDPDYRSRRMGASGVGPRAAESLLEVVALLDRRKALGNIFPELAGAATSLDSLRVGILPEGFAEIDRIVVDEAQDLTLVEMTVFTELCRAIAAQRGYSPCLLIAGDEGQTVRPSGFSWGSLNGLLANQLTPASEFPLEMKLRAPEAISAVIENASAMYASLARGLRPSNQRHLPDGDALDARLFHVEVQSADEALDLIDRLSAIDNLAIVVIDAVVPDWIQSELRSVVLTPQAVKGLEYQSVCVLNPGLALSRMMEPLSEHLESPNLDLHLRRTSMDRFRVALSRAAEALAFIDIGVGDEEMTLSRQMLGSAVQCSPGDLVEYLQQDDVLPEERVLTRMRESRDLIDADPEAAWNCAVQALNLLGRAELPNGVADVTVRREAREHVLYIGSRILVDGAGAWDNSDEATNTCIAVSEALGSSHARAFRELVAWTGGKGESPLDLMAAFLAPDDPHVWLGNALSAVYQSLQSGIEKAVSDPGQARRFSGNVTGWLELSGFAGDVSARANDLRITAFETLLESGRFDSAQSVLAPIDTTIAGMIAEAREREQRWMSAIMLYERAGMEEAASMARSTGIQVLLETGESLMDSVSFPEALDAFNTLLFLDEKHLEALDLRGECLYELGEYDRAIADYTRVIDSDGTYENLAQVYYGRALAHGDKQEFDQALADCLRSISIDPDDAETRVMAAQLYRGSGLLEEAIEHASVAAELDSDSITAHFLMGDCQLMLGNLDEALKHTLRATEIDETSETLQCRLGEIHANKGDFEVALEHLNRAVELNPDRSLTYLYRGRLYDFMKEPELALRDLNTAIHLDPDGEPLAYFFRARTLMALDDFDRAIDDCTSALKRGIESVDIYSLRMQANYNAANPRAALKDCQAAIRLGGETEDLCVMMGYIYLLMMNPDLALREGFEKALTLNPNSSAAQSGAMNAQTLNRVLRGDGHGLVEDLMANLEGLAVLDQILSANSPPGFMDELRRIALDSSAQSLFPMPRSIMQSRPNDRAEEKDN